MRQGVEKIIVLRSAEHLVEPCHRPPEYVRKVCHVVRAGIEEIGAMAQRQDMDFPFVSAGEGLDGDEALAPFDYELPHVDFPAYLS